MPVPGYLGFPVFAVTVFVMTTLATCLWERTSKPLRIFMFLGFMSLSLLMCWVVDNFTVRSFQI